MDNQIDNQVQSQPQPEPNPQVVNVQPPTTPPPNANMPQKTQSKKRFLISILILIMLILCIFAVFGAYYLGKNANKTIVSNQDSNNTVNLTITPTSAPITANDIASWKSYKGTDISFKHPNDWNPTEKSSDGGVNTVSVNLGISDEVINQDLGFSDINLDDIDKTDIEGQLAFLIGNKSGFKLVRKGTDYVSYEYVTTGKNDQGIFIARVTVQAANQVLENQLDQLVASISFNN